MAIGKSTSFHRYRGDTTFYEYFLDVVKESVKNHIKEIYLT